MSVSMFKHQPREYLRVVTSSVVTPKDSSDWIIIKNKIRVHKSFQLPHKIAQLHQL